jgi:hypothetical protein
MLIYTFTDGAGPYIQIETPDGELWFFPKNQMNVRGYGDRVRVYGNEGGFHLDFKYDEMSPPAASGADGADIISGIIYGCCS